MTTEQAGQNSAELKMTTAEVNNPDAVRTREQTVYTAVAATLMVVLIGFGLLGLMGYIRV